MVLPFLCKIQLHFSVIVMLWVTGFVFCIQIKSKIQVSNQDAPNNEKMKLLLHVDYNNICNCSLVSLQCNCNTVSIYGFILML